MKLMGLLLVVITGGGCGLCAERRLKRRMYSVRALARLAELLAERMHSTAAPLTALLSELTLCGELADLPLMPRLAAATERRAWVAAANECAGTMGLNAEEHRALRDFVEGWGETDLESELARNRRYAARFRQLAEVAQAQVQQRGRLYITLGICGGSMAALLLW